MSNVKTMTTGTRFKCAYGKNGYVGVLTVAGDLTPECSQELNMRLRNSMMDVDFVVVDLDQVTSIDADCFTLFCMASRTAYNANKRLHLGCARPEVQIAASHRCSVNLSSAERNGCDTHCFWLNQHGDDGVGEVR